MKYIIESNDVIGYTPKYAMLFGDGYMIQPLEDLEELTADYINEHFGDLQDTAYKKGLHDGESKCRYCNEYQRGLDDAWEAAKKLSWTEKYGGYDGCLDKVFDRTDTFDIFDYSPNEAIDKLKAYEEKQKTADEIKVGDELEHTVSGYTSKAIFLEKIGNDEDEDWYKCLFGLVAELRFSPIPKGNLSARETTSISTRFWRK